MYRKVLHASTKYFSAVTGTHALNTVHVSVTAAAVARDLLRRRAPEKSSKPLVKPQVPAGYDKILRIRNIHRSS